MAIGQGSTQTAILDPSTGNKAGVTGDRLNVDGSGVTQPISVTSLPLPTGAATSANQVTTNASLAAIDAGIPAALGQTTMANSMPVTMASDQPAIPVTGNIVIISATGTDFTFADITTSALTRVVVNRTAYTEQTTNAQRSIASSNANDTSAGTGARTVTLEYLDQTGAGPYYETITLNGTSYVNTVATNIAFIESIRVASVGSTGSNVGIITLKAATAGGGATVGTISATNNQTFWGHHYIPINKTCYVTGISAGGSGTTVGSGALFTLNATSLPTQLETQISDFVRLYGQSSTFSRVYQSPIKITGPARIRIFVTPETSSSTTYRCAFDFTEE